jgi:energy-coupling factor transporter ATP-binding protein EcfA2
MEDSSRVAAGLDVVCEGLSFAYDEGGRRVPAVRDVGLTIAAGASVALLGPTGSGKSTLLQLIRGLLAPDAGRVVLGGTAPSDEEYGTRQREVGLVFQTPELQLFAATAADDVAFGPRQLGRAPDEVDAAVTHALELVGLPLSSFGRRHPYSLSGGEQRRLALAGVLAMRPRLLLLDEPFVSLDPAGRRDLAGVLERLKGEGSGIVLATHDVDQAWALCDERLVLADGELVASGPWGFDDDLGTCVLREHRLEVPFLVELWRRLGRPAGAAPKTTAAAAEALA